LGLNRRSLPKSIASDHMQRQCSRPKKMRLQRVILSYLPMFWMLECRRKMCKFSAWERVCSQPGFCHHPSRCELRGKCSHNLICFNHHLHSKYQFQMCYSFSFKIADSHCEEHG
jgi:hypothetical protein